MVSPTFGKLPNCLLSGRKHAKSDEALGSLQEGMAYLQSQLFFFIVDSTMRDDLQHDKTVRL